MDTAAYLDRINYRGPLEPTASVLTSLHREHMLSIPFENLDILLGHEIELRLESFYDKIVRRGRGGFCYELNGLFAWLLDRIGFGVTLLSGRVFDGDEPGPEFDHMVLLIEMENRMIADVGFGDSFMEPLLLDAGEQAQRDATYRLTDSDAGMVLERRRPGEQWESQYVFTLAPRRLEDYAAMCRHQQTSPDSSFTRRSICSLATPDGRVTLANGRLIVTSGGHREERQVESKEEYRTLLKTRFAIDLGQEADIRRLIDPAADERRDHR